MNFSVLGKTGGRFERIKRQLLMFFFFFTSAFPFCGSATSLEVYIETNYQNQPDLSQYGAKKLVMIYAQKFWRRGQDVQSLPLRDHVINYVAQRYKQYTGPLVLDIEHWPLMGSDEKTVDRVDKFITLWEWVKAAAPKAKVGYYGVVPTPGYRQCLKPGSPQYVKWQKNNDRAQALANRVDAFFPTLYPVEANRANWVRYATARINEAKRLGKGKPIYPFINPRYHPAAYDNLKFKLVPKDYIRLQLETVRAQGASGVVIWGWDNARNPWNESLPWWQAKKEFLGSE